MVERVTGRSELPDTNPASQLPDDESLALAPTLTERRVPRSTKRAPEGAAEDADDSVGDSDEAVVEDAAQDVINDADRKLRVDATADAILPPSSGSSSQRRKTAQARRTALKKARDEGVADVTVQAADENRPTVVETERGKTAVVSLAVDERSREVKVGDETVLVVNNKLSTHEAREEAAQFVAQKLDDIAAQFGLDDFYEPFFQLLVNEGAEFALPFYGDYYMPQQALLAKMNMFSENDREAHLRLRRRNRLRDRGDLSGNKD